jgi:S1-C subfamily serine protease
VTLLIPKTLLALDESMIYRSIFKIRTYTYNSTSQTYTLTHLGSAVAIGSGRLLTNAHVIFDVSGEKPNGYYEVCRTIDFRRDPVCFATAELLAYDESVDLALLSYSEPSDVTGVPLF